MIWTGCDAAGVAQPGAHMGATSGMVAVGTPRDLESDPAPLGAVKVDDIEDRHQIYAISPVFTVVEGP